MFIDEIHMIVGAGSNNAMNVGNMLKPMLARAEIRLIGATTLNEYREYIEKDGALERRFQKILIKQPTVTKAEIHDNKVEYTIEKTLAAELVGDTKIRVSIESWQAD